MKDHKCLNCGCDLKRYGIHDGIDVYKYQEDKGKLFGVEGDYHPDHNYEGDKVDTISSNNYLNNIFYCNKCNSKIGTVSSLENYLNVMIIPF